MSRRRPITAQCDWDASFGLWIAAFAAMTIQGTLACGRRWIAQGLPGSVVSMLVTWVWTGSAYVLPSVMAKTAVHAMTMSLAVGWGKHNIRVNAVAPGPFPTTGPRRRLWFVHAPSKRRRNAARSEPQAPTGSSRLTRNHAATMVGRAAAAGSTRVRKRRTADSTMAFVGDNSRGEIPRTFRAQHCALRELSGCLGALPASIASANCRDLLVCPHGRRPRR